jgi:membrane associated rhomboid family serine protease
MRVEGRAARASVLALAAVACALAAATAVLARRLATLPPTDEAYGMSVWELWNDPFVRLVAVPVALSGAAIGFLASLLLLWRTALSKSIPLVFTVTVVVAALTGSILTSLVCAIGAMAWCRTRFAVARPAGPRLAS